LRDAKGVEAISAQAVRLLRSARSDGLQGICNNKQCSEFCQTRGLMGQSACLRLINDGVDITPVGYAWLDKEKLLPNELYN